MNENNLKRDSIVEEIFDYFKNTDVTIDEYSKETGFDKKSIIVEIAKKYGVSVVEATNWINISKGNLSVATNILSKLSEYKRKTDDKCEYNLDINKPKSISCDKEEEIITFEELHNRTGVDYETFVVELANQFKVPTYKIRCLMELYKNDLNQLYKKLGDITKPSKIEGDDKFDEMICDSNLLKRQDVIQQIKNKEYTYEQKDETSPVYCKLRDGELIGPFFKNNKHQKNLILEHKQFMIEREIKNLIFKYPNIEELIANVRKKCSQPSEAIKEGKVYQAQEITKDSTLSELSKKRMTIEDLDFNHSKEIIDKMTCEKHTIPTNSELFERIQVLERDLGRIVTFMKNKYGTQLEHVKTKNSEIKDALIELINKL